MNGFIEKLFGWAWQRALQGQTVWLTRVFWFWIPFNWPHRFNIEYLSEGEAILTSPFRRANRNHLGTQHACALATVGEFVAGLALLGAFEPAAYRLIMSRLEVDYVRRADGVITAESAIPPEVLSDVRQELQTEGIARRVMVSHLMDAQGERVATVHTHWQIKSWSQVGIRG